MMSLTLKRGEGRELKTGFISNEFDCQCELPNCKVTIVTLDLLSALEEIREEIGPIKISSGFRCGPHNGEVGGKAHSYHLYGMAADIIPIRASITQLVAVADRIFADGGMGVYPGRIHVDVRDGKFRWTNVQSD